MTIVSMPRMAMIFGMALIIVGLLGFYLASQAGSKPWTGLIPAIPGSLMLVGGFLARNEKRRALWMHIAVLFAGLGLLGSGWMVGKAAITGVYRSEMALAMQSLMFALCGGFFILAVISFINARRSGGDAPSAE